MTLREKVGQMTLVDHTRLARAEDVSRLALGAILSGGDSAPEPNTPRAWADLVDGFQKIALSGRLRIPLLWGVDAVHGHAKVHGATVFPHNIGLGAAGDPDLAREVGRVTAREMLATGIRWNFAPCLAVAQDARWGRTYESFGEDPELVASMATMVEGLQDGGVLATAKHWVGDGGTTDGRDAGDTRMDEASLRKLHVRPFAEAVRRGVGCVMVSYSSWNGEPLHQHARLITDVLKGDLGFGGFVVSDWEGVDRLSGDYAQNVVAAVNAGIDMVMAPKDHVRFIETLVGAVEEGDVALARIDDAVARILAAKARIGLFGSSFADRSLVDRVGCDEHRGVARRAVRKSVVLLKNEGGVLPLPKDARRLFVAGRSAHDIGRQCGGWTMGWQGREGAVTPGTTILEGVRAAVSRRTKVKFDAEGRGVDDSYDAVVAVIGEAPYAEGTGDRPAGLRLDEEDRRLVVRLAGAGVPVVAVLVSGRPIDVSEGLEKIDALVAAWLPGTEGAGVADVLFGDHEFRGRLPRRWPRGDEPSWPAAFAL